MARPTERVQLYKIEGAETGGDPNDQNDGYPSPIDSTEDVAQVAGLEFGEDGKPASDELVAAYRDGDELILVDSSYPAGVSLGNVASGGGLDAARLIITKAGGIVYQSEGHIAIQKV